VAHTNHPFSIYCARWLVRFAGRGIDGQVEASAGKYPCGLFLCIDLVLLRASHCLHVDPSAFNSRAAGVFAVASSFSSASRSSRIQQFLCSSEPCSEEGSRSLISGPAVSFPKTMSTDSRCSAVAAKKSRPMNWTAWRISESLLSSYNFQIDMLRRKEIAAWSTATVGLKDTSLSRLRQTRRAGRNAEIRIEGTGCCCVETDERHNSCGQ